MLDTAEFFSRASQLFDEICGYCGNDSRRFFCAGQYYYCSVADEFEAKAWKFCLKKAIGPPELIVTDGLKLLEFQIRGAATCEELCKEFDRFLKEPAIG